MKRILFPLWFASLITVNVRAQTPPENADGTIDKISDREKAVVQDLAQYTPIAETYLQELSPDRERLTVVRDHYYLSQARLGPEVEILPFKARGNVILNFLKNRMKDAHYWTTMSMEYMPNGFANMVHPTVEIFDRKHYRFNFLRREFLGDVRCLVFDVSPLNKPEVGTFKGRIWVEDHDYTIVRYNGFFLKGGDILGHYFHFDSWRVNTGPGLWLPALVYSEETNYGYDRLYKLVTLRHARFKAQTRFWGYNLKPPSLEQELSQITFDPATPVKDESDASRDLSPIEALHAWERQSEDNIADQLEKVGLLAPAGPLDEVLKTVVNNLEVTNKLDVQPEVRCRVLLTSRLELFTAGHTIIISRGLIDVLPNEGTLASVLAVALARIALDARVDTKYAFADRVMFAQRETLRSMRFVSTDDSNEKTKKMAAEYLANSPYKDSLAAVHEFFSELARKSPHLSQLLTANLGDSILAHMIYSDSDSTSSGKSETRLHGALPLGSRTKIDPWTNHIEILKTVQGGSSPKDNMPFEATPFFLYLKRQPKTTAANLDAATGNTAATAKPD